MLLHHRLYAGYVGRAYDLLGVLRLHWRPRETVPCAAKTQREWADLFKRQLVQDRAGLKSRARQAIDSRGGLILPDGFAARAGQCTESVGAIAARSGRRGRVRVDDYLPELLLADSPGTSDRLVQRVFGPLERAEAVDLSDTLRCLALHGFDNTAAAAALPVHRNTLLYRLGRIEKLTGLSLKEQRDRTLVLLAVIWEGVAADVQSASRHPNPFA